MSNHYCPWIVQMDIILLTPQVSNRKQTWSHCIQPKRLINVC